MNAKENPALGQGEDSSKSRLAPTHGQSHPSPSKASEKSAQGQLATDLDLLRSRPGEFVGVNEIMVHARCAATHSAISTLRQRYGFRIRNRLKRSKGGVMLSDYQLQEDKS